MDHPTPTLHEAERFVGRPYIDGQYDCADLAMEVQWTLFGRVIALPSQRARPSRPSSQAKAIEAYAPSVATPIAAPVHGCGVLMWESTAIGQRWVQQWHIGTAFIEGGVVWVLHSTVHAGAVLQRLGALRGYGLHVHGYYAWLAPVTPPVTSPSTPPSSSSTPGSPS